MRVSLRETHAPRSLAGEEAWPPRQAGLGSHSSLIAVAFIPTVSFSGRKEGPWQKGYHGTLRLELRVQTLEIGVYPPEGLFGT